MTMIQNTAQFDGRPDEDPHAHIAKFVQICNMFKINGVSDDAIRLRLFPFSLREVAYRWLTSLPSGSIRTWAEMLDKFLGRYFPPSKVAKLRLDISSFKQGPSESFYEAYERYKDLLRRCPQHGLDDFAKVRTFYHGLDDATRHLVDAAAGGSLGNKYPDDAEKIFEDMASNEAHWSTRGKQVKLVGSMNEPNAIDVALAKKLDTLTRKIEALTTGSPSSSSPVSSCNTCGGGHNTTSCPIMSMKNLTMEQVQYLNNNQGQSGGQYRAYAPKWNHPGLAYGNPSGGQYPPGFQHPPKPQERKSSLDEMVLKIVQDNQATIRSLQVTVQNLENQMGKMAKTLSERPHGSLPSNTETNPREQCKAITLMSGKEIESPTGEQQRKNSSGKDALDLLSNRKKLEEVGAVTLNAQCSAVLQHNMPKKLKDPGSFVVPCTLGEGITKKALADSGASINVMPYSLYMKLGLDDPNPTGMTIQLADRSVKRPKGLAEDVLIKINEFVFPADFVLFDVNDNVDVPIILGRPFLATAQALEDHAQGKLALRVGDQEVTFQIPEAMRHTVAQDDTSYSVDDIDLLTSACMEDLLMIDQLHDELNEAEDISEEVRGNSAMPRNGNRAKAEMTKKRRRPIPTVKKCWKRVQQHGVTATSFSSTSPTEPSGMKVKDSSIYARLRECLFGSCFKGKAEGSFKVFEPP
ncbi:hypothetical protein J5N97_003777 [Dioscorea zingiberensis]|uniref:Retrotransposon gag domain-containing protein n=1 Tax=Dioscorea zingiberensis TaxID=325984 RepID=A0A9D5D589_9LILI|nr:hypothetical protein J5N97_003777 [Dioscorea zingiberensis]